jgi:hypothetical protein
MELLFSLPEGGTYPSIDTSHFSYRSWKDGDVWKQTLQVYGRATFTQGLHRKVLSKSVIVTLEDKETHLWRYLELDIVSRVVPSEAAARFFLFLLLAMFGASLSVWFAYHVEETQWLHLSWYFRYPLFIVVAVALMGGVDLMVESFPEWKRL